MKTIITIVALVASMAANAALVTGNDLHSILYEPGDKQSAGIGYIAGIFDAADHCAPKTVTLDQVVDMVKEMLKANPEIRNMDASLLVGAMLIRTWPCKKKVGNI